MLKRLPYIAALIGLMALIPYSALSCGRSPSPVYKDSAYVRFSYNTDNPSIYDSMDTKYLMLLEQYIPGIKNVKVNDSNQWLSYDEGKDTKTSYDEVVSALLKAKGIEWQAPNSAQEGRYYSYWDKPGICHDNSNKAALDFLNEAFADMAVKGGYLELAQIRAKITDICMGKAGSEPIIEQINLLKQKNISADYPAYLEAAVYFYSQDYDKALSIFKSLAKKDISPPSNRIVKLYYRLIGKTPSSKWLKETATYMIARVHLVKSQYKWDGYSDVASTVDKAEVNFAKQGFESYLKNYPNGIYANSAKGLQRKVDNLAGDAKALELALKIDITEAFNLPESSEKASIIYNRYLEFSRYATNIDISKDDPLLVAYGVMNDSPLSTDTLAKFDVNKNRYVAYPDLYKFLKAVILFRSKQYKQLLERIPAEKDLVDTPTSISTEAIRAQTFEALGKEKEAIAAWQRVNSIHKNDDTSQLALAGLYANNLHFKEMMIDKTITNGRILEDFLQFATTNQELIQLENATLPREKKLLVEQELLKRYLLAGDFKSFSTLIANSTTSGIFKKIQKSAETLSENPNDSVQLTTIGFFIHDQYITPEGALGEGYPSNSSLEQVKLYCNSCKNYSDSSLVKHMRSPYDYFVKAEDNYRTTASDDNEARTLHYLVKCSRSSEFGSRCTWNKDYKNIGQSYFKKLHSVYPNSTWAKSTPYYY